MQNVLGQPRAMAILQAPLANGRIHHAFIFHGPTGVGKFTAALALARVLLCQSPQTNLAGEVEACAGCEACRLTAGLGKPAGDDTPDDGGIGSAHPDLHVVRKELALFSDDKQTRDRKLTQIPVEVLRTALLEPVYRAAKLPGRRAAKVFIVDEAELLNPVGQNLLLKTLEEPPAGTVLILVTSSEDRLLPTIRSRCQRVPFVPLADSIVRDWLDRQASAAGLAPVDREWLISFASGSLGRAQLALDYDLAAWAGQVLPALDGMAQGKAPPGGDLGAVIASLIDGFAAAWVDRHDNASKDAANKLAAGLMWSMIATHARRRVASAADAIRPGDWEAGEAATQPWLAAIDAVTQAEAHLAANVNLSLVCDHLVVTLARSLQPPAVRSVTGR